MADRPLRHDVILLLLGALLTSGVGTGISWYVTHREQAAQDRQAARIRFAQSGVGLEAQVLNRTALIYAKITRSRFNIANNAVDVATAYHREQFMPIDEMWSRSIFLLRNQIGRIFGDIVARRLYDRANVQFYVDLCGVVVRRGEPRVNGDCARRRITEMRALQRANFRINEGRDVTRILSRAIIPNDFQSTLRIAKVIAQRTLTCRGADARRYGDKCADLPVLIEIMNRRVDLVGVMQEKLADEFRAAIPAEGSVSPALADTPRD